jgi:Myb-like DNA-binding protein REB1
MLHSSSKLYSVICFSLVSRRLTSCGRAVTDLGQAWEKVSKRVGRMSADCRDRYRNHIANRDVRVSGTFLISVFRISRGCLFACLAGQWKKEEEEELTRIVTEMTVQQGRDVDNDVFWGQVSQRMGNRRGRQQCRIKW